jgi:hypothetical protein
MSYFIVTLVTAAVRGCLGGCRILCDKATILRDTIKGTLLYVVVPLLSFSLRHVDVPLSSALHGGG